MPTIGYTTGNWSVTCGMFYSTSQLAEWATIYYYWQLLGQANRSNNRAGYAASFPTCRGLGGRQLGQEPRGSQNLHDLHVDEKGWGVYIEPPLSVETDVGNE